MLAARANGLGNVFGLGGRHHEDDMSRRFLQGFEQRVKGCLGDLVRLVENIDLVAIAGGRIARGIAQLTNLVDPAVGGRIDLDHVHGVALAYLGACVAGSTRFRSGALGRTDLSAAVQGHGQNTSDRCFPDAAMPGENVPMRNAVLLQRIQERARHMVLAGYVGKALRTIFSGQNLVAHRR